MRQLSATLAVQYRKISADLLIEYRSTLEDVLAEKYTNSLEALSWARFWLAICSDIHVRN